MGDYTTRVLTEEQFYLFVKTIKAGYVTEKGKKVRGNERIAFALILQANLGLRISDVVKLRLNDIVRDGNRYRLDIVEQKTGKMRNFSVPDAIYTFIQSYSIDNEINPKHKLVGVSTRAVQLHLKDVREKLGYENISTHSFRKYFATSVYESSGKDLNLTRILMQHSSPNTTIRYLGVQESAVEEILKNHVKLP